MPDLTWQQKMMLFGQGLSGGNPMATRAAWENQAMQNGLLQQQMEEERKRQEGMLQSGIQSMAMQPQRGPGQAVDVSALGPEGMELMKSRGMLSPAAGGVGYMEAPRPEIAQARSEIAMKAATTKQATAEATKAANVAEAINQAAMATNEHNRDLKLLEAHYAKGGSLQEFNLERSKLRTQSDILKNLGAYDAVSMSDQGFSFSLKNLVAGGGPDGKGGTGDLYKDIPKTLEGFNNIRVRLIEKNAEARKLPAEQAKFREELVRVSMNEFLALSAVPGEGGGPNPYVLQMLKHYGVNTEGLNLNDPSVVVGLATQIGELAATRALGPKEAAAAEIGLWGKAVAWMKGVGKGQSGTATHPSDEARYRKVKRGISSGQRQ